MMACAIAIASWIAHVPVSQAHALAAAATQEEAAVRVAAEEPPSLAGRERVKPKLVTPALVDAAEAFLAASGKRAVVGSERYESVEGRPYVLVVEWHYHPPGYVGAPMGWHKGVTVYELR